MTHACKGMTEWFGALHAACMWSHVGLTSSQGWCWACCGFIGRHKSCQLPRPRFRTALALSSSQATQVQLSCTQKHLDACLPNSLQSTFTSPNYRLAPLLTQPKSSLATFRPLRAMHPCLPPRLAVSGISVEAPATRPALISPCFSSTPCRRWVWWSVLATRQGLPDSAVPQSPDMRLAPTLRLRGVHHRTLLAAPAPRPGALVCCSAAAKQPPRNNNSSFDSEDELDRDLAGELQNKADPERAKRAAQHLNLAWSITKVRVVCLGLGCGWLGSAAAAAGPWRRVLGSAVHVWVRAPSPPHTPLLHPRRW